MSGMATRLLDFFGRPDNGATKEPQVPKNTSIAAEKAVLVARKVSLDTEYAALAVVIAPESGATEGKRNWARRRRSEVKKEMTYLQKKLTELNAERKQRGEALFIERHFIDVCRETMSREQFSALLHHAIERATQQAEGAKGEKA